MRGISGKSRDRYAAIGNSQFTEIGVVWKDTGQLFPNLNHAGDRANRKQLSSRFAAGALASNLLDRISETVYLA
jgi:hypothetical protein